MKKTENLSDENLTKQSWMEELKTYQGVKTIDRQMMVTLIDRVIVYDKDKVEVCFRFADEMAAVISMANEQEDIITVEENESEVVA